MADDLVDAARRVLDRGSRLEGELEVYVQHARKTEVKVYGREVESLVTGEPRGVGVRYLLGGRRGYAYTADFSGPGIDLLLEQAAANADATEPDPYVGLADPPRAYQDIPGLWRHGLVATPISEKIRLALEAEAVALASPEIETVEESSYVDSAYRLALLSSRGLEAYTEQTFCYLYLSAHARRGEDVQTALGFSTAREPGELKPEEAGREAAERAARRLGAKPCKTGLYTVVFDRGVAAAIFSVAAQALTAEAVQKGRSLLAGRLGERVAASGFTLIDDGLHPEGMYTAPFDDEGVSHQRTAVFEAGRLCRFLHNCYTARKEGDGTGSTGNAARDSYRGTVGVSPTNLILEPGTGSVEELLVRTGAGLYVTAVTGLHSGANPVSGEFSVGASGHLIENGSLGAPVREVTIASDLLSLLSNVADRAGDPRWIPFHGSVLTPSVAIGGVAVSGV